MVYLICCTLVLLAIGNGIELLAAAITVAVEERLPHTEYRLSGRTEMSGTGKQ